MTQIRVIRFVAIFLTIAISSDGQSLLNPPNCSSVCGFKVANDTNFRPEINGSSDFTFHNTNECVENATPPITAWNKSAHDFMRYLGMNDGNFGCPMQNSFPNITYQLYQEISYSLQLNFKYTARNYGLIGPTIPKNLTFLESGILVEEPNNIPGSCAVQSLRAVKQQLPNNRFTTDWLASIPLYDKKTMATEGVIFSAFNATSGSLLNFRVPKNANDKCIMNNCTSFSSLWLPASTFDTSVNVSWPKDKLISYTSTPSYSMFARFKFDELPGAKEVLEKLKKDVEDVENVYNDLSPSNLAILCLPLLMAIPPLSLLGPASDATIAWYAFATDVLAAIPLMIKGIEIVLFYRRAFTDIVSTLGLAGEKFQIFEIWEIRCEPHKNSVANNGVTIVSVAFWFMVASTYVEFLFWREMRYKEGCLKKFEDNTERLPDMEPMNSTAAETDNTLKQILRCCFRGRRKYFAVFSVILTVELFLLFTVLSFASYDYYLRIYSIVPILTAITLVVFRAVLVKRFRQFIQWRFWAGVVFGFVTGPVYLLLHAFEDVRKSDAWEVFAEGCNAGIGFLALAPYMLLRQEIYSMQVNPLLWIFFGFPWVYGASVILTHAIRSEASERKAWRFGCHGFALGLLFGPFGLLFKRCFPECVEHKPARHNFLGGLIYGTIFGVTLIAVAMDTLYVYLKDIFKLM